MHPTAESRVTLLGEEESKNTAARTLRGWIQPRKKRRRRTRTNKLLLPPAQKEQAPPSENQAGRQQGLSQHQHRDTASRHPGAAPTGPLARRRRPLALQRARFSCGPRGTAAHGGRKAVVLGGNIPPPHCPTDRSGASRRHRIPPRPGEEGDAHMYPPEGQGLPEQPLTCTGWIIGYHSARKSIGPTSSNLSFPPESVCHSASSRAGGDRHERQCSVVPPTTLPRTRVFARLASWPPGRLYRTSLQRITPAPLPFLPSPAGSHLRGLCRTLLAILIDPAPRPAPSPE